MTTRESSAWQRRISVHSSPSLSAAKAITQDMTPHISFTEHIFIKADLTHNKQPSESDGCYYLFLIVIYTAVTNGMCFEQPIEEAENLTYKAAEAVNTSVGDNELAFDVKANCEKNNHQYQY